MHLYALEGNGQVTYAGHANKQTNYICLECKQTVRVRSGFHRQPHFYHLLTDHKCRLNGKSMPHLMLQQHLKSILPEGEVELEHRFTSINRIADVAWISKKIVFEVQCSPISATEILQRNTDYASQGYQVVWILHQNRYNQYKVSGAEDVLKNHPHYFTNMDTHGKGEIFDQVSLIDQGVRKCRLPKMSIDVTHPLSEISIDKDDYLPKIIQNRLMTWQISFKNDWIHFFKSNLDLGEFSDQINKIKEAENYWLKDDFSSDTFELSIYSFVKALYNRWIYLPYHSILKLLLEKASR